MNKVMRKELDALLSLLGSIDLEHIGQTLTDLQQEEQDKFDNLSEGLQASDKGLAIEDAANNLQEAIDYLEEAQAALEEAVTAIEGAKE